MASAGLVAITGTPAIAGEPQGVDLPTGQVITPTAGAGVIFSDLNPRLTAAPGLRAGQAAAVSVSPDGRTLAILTSGYNLHFGRDGKPIPELSTEYVFVFDLSSGEPVQSQVLPLPNSFQGLAWSPTSDEFYVSGGPDDRIVEFTRTGSAFAEARTFRLGHTAGVGLAIKPETGGLAVSPDGTWVLVANFQNDSVSLLDLRSGQLVTEQDLRPGSIDAGRHGQPGGSFPRCVAWISSSRAYVGSERDREIISIEVSKRNIRILRRILVHGQPVALLANGDGSRLYVALDNTGEVAIFDTAREVLIESLDVTAPQSVYANTKKLGGANPNGLALTPDEGVLLVSNGGENAVAVVRLSDHARRSLPGHEKHVHSDGDDEEHTSDPEHSAVIGLVPTGWYPTGIATSRDGATWYVVNGKSETGPDVRGCRTIMEPSGAACYADNRIPWQLEKAGFLTLPAPRPLELARLTKQVARNNHYDQPENAVKDEQLFSFLRAHIKHVIYIIKENRSYDQILGDLEIGNGDPRFTLFPEALSPNHHAIARGFVTLDNFLVSAEDSDTGWDWSVSARTNDFREREAPLEMAGRSSWWNQGVNRNINMGYATSAERKAEFPLSPSDPDILPGTRDVSAADGPGGEEGKGFLWDAALRGGRTVRNWGFYGDGRNYFAGIGREAVPLVHDPYAQKLRVFFPTKASLMPYSDPYFRDFEPAFPDYWRVQEWKREFAEFSAAKSAPNLMLVRICTDHFGGFEQAIDGVNTVDTQMADNDYALGLIVEAVANSPFAMDTLVVSIEDDTFDGPDHVDAHRSVALFVGPYVRQHRLVSTRYTTVSVVKTIEEILGLEPMGLNDALAAPMSDVFDPVITTWSYRAIVPDVLRSTKLPLPPGTGGCNVVSRRSSEYWAAVTASQDFSRADHFDVPAFNHALWRGLKGDAAYPIVTGTDLRGNRSRLLRRAHVERGVDGCSRNGGEVPN